MVGTFEERAARGDIVGTLRYAVAVGALWAIGSAWATGIRESVRALFPDNALDVVLAEALSVGITTLFGSTLALVALGGVRRPRLVTRPATRNATRPPLARVVRRPAA